MELKVWVEGIQRIVCGVTENTTCQDVVFALAHATGKVGRFTLIERWRNNERLLAPQEYPLKILMKWGEYSNDIQFILRRSDTGRENQKSQSQNSKSTSTCNPNASNPNILENSSPSQSNAPLNSNSNVCHKNNSTSTSSNNTSPGNPVGVVKGVQQTRHIDSNSPLIKETPLLKDVPPYREPPPPYRSPPPPQSRKSPSRGRAHASPVSVEPSDKAQEPVCFNSQYRELVSLVNFQREKLSSQQADLIKYDAEIGYWETKGREQERQAEIIQHQINTADSQLKAATEQVQCLVHIEQESEACAHKEKALRAEVALFRNKLASCEAELQQCRLKMRKLLDEIQHEQRVATTRQHDNRQNVERSMLAEMENLQSQIQQAKHATEVNHLTAETLKREVGVLEAAILEKKRQVERLVQEMKEANLQSLADSADDLRHPLDGSYKSGSARRIIGSPRQLENAAPTNKNPHGVWV